MASQSQEQAASKKPQVRWSEQMNSILIDTLLEACVTGGSKNADNGWKPEALQKVVREVQKKTGIVIHNDNVRARLKTLKKDYLAAKDALSQSGFGFDNATQCVTTDLDSWQSCIEKRPDAAKLRGKVIKYYTSLDIIVGNEQATGETTFGAENIVNLDGEEGTQDNVVNLDEEGSSQRSRPTPRQKRKRSRGAYEGVTGLMETLVEVGNNIASALRRPSWSTVEECMSSVPDLTDPDKFRVMGIFIERPELGHIFVGMSPGVRAAWINEKLGR